MKTKLPVLALGFLASALTARPVAAATANTSISVNATVQVSCLVSAATSTFSTYPSAALAASAVSVACSNSAPYTLTFSPTSPHTATSGLRETTDASVIRLRYALSSNSRHNANWGQVLSTPSAAVSGSGFARELATLGRLSSASQGAMSGGNPDTMIVVVTY